MTYYQVPRNAKILYMEVLGNRLIQLDGTGINPTRKRCFEGDIYVLGGNFMPNELIFDSRLVNWRICDQMKVPNRDSFGAVVHKRNIYTVGGTSSPKAIYMFDTVNKKWSQLANLNEYRYGLGVCSVSDHIYACGGLSSNYITLNTVERYDVGSNCWVDITPMKENRGHFKVVYMEGSIWAIGGWNRTDVALNSVERFDPRLGWWSQCTPMLEKRKNHAGTVLDNKIFVCGGQSFEEYDPRNNKWRLLSPMLHKKLNLSLVTFGGMIWAIGGNSNTVEIYDIRQNKWTPGTPLPWSVSGHAAVVVPHSLL